MPMAVNKVVYGTTILVDLTEDTISSDGLLLGQRAHGANGEIINGTLTGSETGVLVRLKGLTVEYVSGTQAKIDISGKTSIYADVSEEQLIVKLTHLGLYASGLILGGSLNVDIEYSYTPSTGIITLTASSTAFSNSYLCTADVFITEQTPETPKTPQEKTITPALISQTVSPDDDKELVSVTVQPVTGTLLQTMDSDLKPSNIREGVDLFGITGTLSPEGGSTDLSPFKDIATGVLTPTSNTTSFAVDTSKGTPAFISINCVNRNGVAVSSNAITSAYWTQDMNSTVVRVVRYYSSSSRQASSTNYGTYSNGVLSLNYQLKAGWTYHYCVMYK